MKRRLQKGRRSNGRRRKGSSGMTFLSTLAHHLRKWLAPKKTPRSQPGRQAGRDSRTDSQNRRRVTRWLCCQFVFLQFFPPSRERKRAVNYARQSKCIHVRLLNVIYNQPAAALSPHSLLPFSFHLPFILVIIHWHSCHSIRTRMRIVMFARLDLVQRALSRPKAVQKFVCPIAWQ